MKTIRTKGIVLNRTNFGEADRILVFLTPDQGKQKLIAKGVRKIKSKLAGGVEFFSTSDISFIDGRGEINTLVSSRLIKYYSNIVKELERSDLAFKLIKILNKATEDKPEAAYFELLGNTFKALDDSSIGLALIENWFSAQLLKLSGHSPNLKTDAMHHQLEFDRKYDFNLDSMNFNESTSKRGSYQVNEIKFLRLLFSKNTPKALQRIQDCEKHSSLLQPLLNNMISLHIRL